MYFGRRLLGVVCTALVVIATVTIIGKALNMDNLVQTGYNSMTAKREQPRGARAKDNHAKETAQYRLQEQRNQLSQALKQLSQQFHQYQCMATMATGPQSISTSGGWCPRPDETYSYKTDEKLSAAMVPLFNTGTVAGFGDGGGGYKQKIEEAGLVQRYDSFDGAPFCDKTTNGSVKYLDLSIPVYGLPLYDWVLSLEVGEHIPKKYEHIFLDNIVRHARNGVVLSWATPGQRGHGHVNCRSMEYIKNKLDARGFYHDANNSQHLQQNCKYSWLRNNVNLYKRKPDSPVDMLML